MRKGTRLYVVVVIGLLAIVFNASPRSQSTGDAEKELARIEKEWRTARISGDVGFLERLYAKELRITGADGSLISREQDIKGFATGAIKPESIEADDMQISVYGSAAVVIGRDTLRGSYNGVRGEGTLRFTHVYIERDGRWQLVASQGTLIQKK